MDLNSISQIRSVDIFSGVLILFSSWWYFLDLHRHILYYLNDHFITWCCHMISTPTFACVFQCCFYCSGIMRKKTSKFIMKIVFSWTKWNDIRGLHCHSSSNRNVLKKEIIGHLVAQWTQKKLSLRRQYHSHNTRANFISAKHIICHVKLL